MDGSHPTKANLTQKLAGMNEEKIGWNFYLPASLNACAKQGTIQHIYFEQTQAAVVNLNYEITTDKSTLKLHENLMSELFMMKKRAHPYVVQRNCVGN